MLARDCARPRAPSMRVLCSLAASAFLSRRLRRVGVAPRPSCRPQNDMLTLPDTHAVERRARAGGDGTGRPSVHLRTHRRATQPRSVREGPIYEGPQSVSAVTRLRRCECDGRRDQISIVCQPGCVAPSGLCLNWTLDAMLDGRVLCIKSSRLATPLVEWTRRTACGIPGALARLAARSAGRVPARLAIPQWNASRAIGH